VKLSVIIPSYKDPYLYKTVDSLVENSLLKDDMEIIVVLDGYWLETPLRTDANIVTVHMGKNRNMRESINTGVRLAQGKYIMRTDEHCMFAPGYDKQLVDDMDRKCKKGDWIMTATRYFLDPIKWERMDLPPVDYEKLKVRDMGDGHFKFEGVVWHERAKTHKDKMVDQTMAMQGSMWIMPKSWWDKVIVELDSERYGDMLQDSHEMQFKTWKAGGKLVVNKNTWFAHKHVSFPRTHNHPRQDYTEGLDNIYNDYKDFYEEVRKKWTI
jgi:glycosyltransferase involved in cell wall biosynthesis